MKGFKLDSNGDIQITNGVIDMVYDEELTAQRVKTVLGTNKGEWFMDGDEGIDFGYMLGKGITEDMMRSQIASGIRQVDSSFTLDTFNLEVDEQNRKATIKFTAKNDSGTEIASEKSYE